MLRLVVFLSLLPTTVFCQTINSYAPRKELGVLDTVITISEYDLLPVYGRNSTADSFQVNLYFPMNRHLTLTKKLNLLTQYLSRYYFHGLPIEIIRIKEANGKKTVIINLKEHPYAKDATLYWGWETGYFQGSSGGSETAFCLIESLLQRKYNAEWIDAVTFYYEGKPINDDWDHIRLNGVFNR